MREYRVETTVRIIKSSSGSRLSYRSYDKYLNFRALSFIKLDKTNLAKKQRTDKKPKICLTENFDTKFSQTNYTSRLPFPSGPQLSDSEP